MITQIKENKPEDKDKVLIEEVGESDEETSDNTLLTSTEEIKSWNNDRVKCLIRETHEVP
jgi:hypothetical protein